ncbi:MAG: hypothetical protein Q8R26_01470 [bacterium]|nr:hypothetical protein [bacterium]
MYNPRPRNKDKGGNRGIDDEDFSHKAPKGKFRVIVVDKFDDHSWIEDDFSTLAAATTYVNNRTKCQQILKMYVCDDTGAHR